MSHSPQQSEIGFTLIELLVVTIIVSMVSAWGLPNVLRKLRQAEVDRYTQSIETGVFSLRSRLGTTRTSCTLSFPTSNTFLAAWEMLEFQQSDQSVASQQRIECCNSSFEQVSSEGCLNNLDADLPKTFRLIQREGSSDANAVSVAVSTTSFTMTPPGTSAETNELTIRVRSRKHDDPSVLKADDSSQLITRCIQVSGTGSTLRGNWDEQTKTCITQ